VRWPLDPDSWRREDRVLTVALKVGFVLGVLALETIVVASLAYVMWHAVRR